jgi:hypothetical protein
MKHNYKNNVNKLLAGLLVFGITTITSCKNNDDADINQNQDTGVTGDNSGEQRATDQYIVVFKSDKSGTVGQAAPGLGGTNPLQMEANKILKDKGVQELSVSPTISFAGAINGMSIKLSPEQLNALKNSPNIAHIEVDKEINVEKGNVIGKPTRTKNTTTTTTTTTTTSGGTSTSCVTNAGGTQPAQTIPWGVTAVGGHLSGVGKTAWVFDTGIDFNHPELTVDQSRSRSFLTSGQAATYYQSACDEMGHGTWVAGIIGAKDNGIGLVGVAAGATLVSIRVMDRNGSGYVSSVVNGINYVIANAKAGDVANFSISFGASSTMDDAIRQLAAKGVYVVSGSGNSSTDCTTCSPARVDASNVYTVSGMDANGVFVSSSNYGKPVDYCAPGDQIYTTDLNGGYKVVRGTSFATAFGSGVLLNTNGQPKHFSYVKCDPDPYTDPIIHRHPKP